MTSNFVYISNVHMNTWLKNEMCNIDNSPYVFYRKEITTSKKKKCYKDT
jgi:hypothetical protein